jgi:hypothetical protein
MDVVLGSTRRTALVAGAAGLLGLHVIDRLELADVA